MALGWAGRKPGLVRNRYGHAQAQARRLGRHHRSRRGGKKGLIERAHALGSRLGLAVWCEGEAGPFQAVPHPGSSGRPHGQPAAQPREHVRGGTSQLLTLFHPATGQVRVQPVASCTNPVLHGWLEAELTAILAALPTPVEWADAAATRAVRTVWQDGLTERFTLPEQRPPLRLLLAWDNLAGHKSAEMGVWLCQHGVMPLHTPLGGSGLNRAEPIQRILKRRALDGQHPRSPAEISAWFKQTAQAWNQQPTPFAWNGKRQQQRRKRRGDTYPAGGSAAHALQPLSN